MKQKYFNWSRFPLRFLKAVLSSEATPTYARPDKYYDDADMLCPYMDDVAEWPNSHFVRKYRREIEDYFLPEDNHLVEIASHLEKKNYGGIKMGEPEDILMELRRQKLSNTIIDAYRVEMLKVGMDADDGWEPATDFTKPFTFDLLSSSVRNISLYPYQEEAVDAMKRHFIDEDKSAGILVMVTCLLGIPGLLIAYNRIYKKYRA